MRCSGSRTGTTYIGGHSSILDSCSFSICARVARFCVFWFRAESLSFFHALFDFVELGFGRKSRIWVSNVWLIANVLSALRLQSGLRSNASLTAWSVSFSFIVDKNACMRSAAALSSFSSFPARCHMSYSSLAQRSPQRTKNFET